MPDVALALDAYSVGQLGGRVAFVVLGAGLVRAGLAKRAAARRPAPVVPAQPTAADRWAWMEEPAAAGAPPHVPSAVPDEAPRQAPAPAAADFFAPPVTVLPGPAPAPPGPRPAAPWPASAPTAPSSTGRTGLPQLVAGGLLLTLGVVGLLLRFTAVGGGHELARPDVLLGLPVNPALTAQHGVDDLHPALRGAGVDDAQMTFYGEPSAGLLVIAVAGEVPHPARDVDALEDGFTQLAPDVYERTEVDAGRSGGSARCWSGRAASGGLATTCVFADHDSIVVVADTAAADLQHGAERARRVREAVLSG